MTLPVRIAFCITELDPGGAERMLYELASGLDRGRWEPRVWCLGPEAEFAAKLRERGVPVTCLGGRGIRSALSVGWKLRADWKAWRPAIVQSFLFHANLLGRIAGRSAGVPIVLSGQRVADRRSPWYARWDRWTSRMVDRHVCVSRGVANYLVGDCGFPARQMVVIPNGVELSRIQQAAPISWSELGLPQQARVILAVGRLEAQKGFDDLLAATAPVLAEHHDVHVVIVGDGPLRGEFEEFIRRNGLQGRIHLPGRRDDVPSLMRAAELFVLSSRWEGMANVVLEAMAAGLPIIATDVEGVADVLENEVNGLVIPAGQPDEISRSIRRILVNPALACALGKQAQDSILKRFTISHTAQAYEQLYFQLLDARPPGRLASPV